MLHWTRKREIHSQGAPKCQGIKLYCKLLSSRTLDFRTWHEPDVAKGASLNSEGLPNSGIDYYLDSQTIADSMAADPSKPYMVSISGKTLADNIAMLKKIVNHTSRIAAIELNLACPNVIGKPIIAYDFEQLKNVLAEVTKVPGISKIPLGIKMPPYFDGVQFQLAAGIINAYSSSIGYVACINTIGNALAIDIVSEAPVIASNNGYAGLSGHAVKYTGKIGTMLSPLSLPLFPSCLFQQCRLNYMYSSCQCTSNANTIG